MELRARNTNSLQFSAYALLTRSGELMTSRNGPVLKASEPVTVILSSPRERVNFCPIRDANPFFHYLEALAMLGCANDVEFLSHFAKNMRSFSDDGKTYNAFYGTRLRAHVLRTQPYEPLDQLSQIVANLRQDPYSRQEVALLWHPEDLVRKTKDKACNLALIFSVTTSGAVEMTTLNRSNDAIWGGVSGANIVHLSFFHEYVAQALGRPMGRWFHFSNNFHVYTENPKWVALRDAPPSVDPYESGLTRVGAPLFYPGEQKEFDEELRSLLTAMRALVGHGHTPEGQLITLRPGFRFSSLADAVVLFNVWQMRRSGYPEAALLKALLAVQASDWRMAATNWVIRHRLPSASPASV